MKQIRLKSPILLFIFIFLNLSLSACRPKQERLVIFAASSLNEAFSEIITEFVLLNPDIKIATSYASSSTLRIQIEEGAAADIYASANLLHKDILESQGLIASNSQIIFARNKMGIAYNFVGQEEFSIDLLIQPVLRIVMALPEVPAGAYAI